MSPSLYASVTSRLCVCWVCEDFGCVCGFVCEDRLGEDGNIEGGMCMGVGYLCLFVWA